MTVLLESRTNSLKVQTVALYFAVRDPRTPIKAKLFAGIIVAYALCPLDFIPDFIPVLGHLDDLLVVFLGLRLAHRLIPDEVMAESHERAMSLVAVQLPRNYLVAVFIVISWFVIVILIGSWSFRSLLSIFKV